MGKYITINDVGSMFNRLDTVDTTAINSYHIPYAEAYIEGALGNSFPIPFSSNNVTVKDLSLDMVYLRVSNLNFEDRTAKLKEINDRLQRIRDGIEAMVTTDGTPLQMIGDAVFSNTMTKNPTFGMSNIIEAVVDSAYIIEERNAKGWF